jgi:hypothetical protein
MQQRQVTMTITVLASSDDRAREIVEAMTEEDGSALACEIVDIRDVRAQEPPQ